MLNIAHRTKMQEQSRDRRQLEENAINQEEKQALVRLIKIYLYRLRNSLEHMPLFFSQTFYIIRL
jgi:hypothetical protein